MKQFSYEVLSAAPLLRIIGVCCRTRGPGSLIDLLGFNGIFSTNRLHRAYNKYDEVKKVKLIRKSTMLRVENAYNKQLQ